MRNPNGYGSVIKLSGNRRRPFVARVTTGYRDNGQPIYKALDYFTRRWTALMEELGMKHTTHECRHTFRSKLDSAVANKVAIDLIMGHKSGDIGERVYTHKTLSELQEAIRKLSYGLPVSNA